MSGFAEERQGTARYLQALAQHWPFIVGSVALAIAAALAYLATVESRYEAHADILVSPVSPNDETLIGLPVIRDSGEGRGVLTAARLVKTPQVADGVRAQLRLRVPRDDVLASAHVEPQEQSNIVTVTAEASSPAQAAAIANAFAVAVIAERTRVFQRELRQMVRRLSNRLDDLPATSREGAALADRLGGLRGLIGARDPTLQIASLAVPPANPSWPRPVLSIAAAILVGFVLGIGVAIALELVNPLVLRDEDIFEEGLTLLARVPRSSTRELQTHLEGGATAASDVKDAYRVARVNLNVGRADKAGPGSILVTSAGRQEGKTTAAVNLALVYVHSGARVVLVDADFRRARLAGIFGLGTVRNSLREVLLEETSVEDALVPSLAYGDRLRLLPALPDDGEAVDLLQSGRVESVVEELTSQADVVIFDAPPLTEVADALPLAPMVDAVVIVVRFGRTRRDRLGDARLVLAQLGVLPAGVLAVMRRRASVRPSQQPATRDRPVRQRKTRAKRSASRARSSSSRD